MIGRSLACHIGYTQYRVSYHCNITAGRLITNNNPSSPVGIPVWGCATLGPRWVRCHENTEHMLQSLNQSLNAPVPKVMFNT